MQIDRKEQLAIWAGKQLAINPPILTTVSGDASFRRYFRFSHQNTSIIAVDAPPDKENNQAFKDIGELLSSQDVHVPDILYACLNQGFLLLSDLGDQLYLPTLNKNNADNLYKQAMSTLLKIQQTPRKLIKKIPKYDSQLLNNELNLFNTWFVPHYLNIILTNNEEKMLGTTFQRLIASAENQPQVLVHRDYHSRNLMICSKESPGVIDFQDAVIGPITYDLVSLLKDSYIEWPTERIKVWTLDYYHWLIEQQLVHLSFSEFYRQFELMGMQRHIKVLGIFSRLNYRDNKPSYLNDIPLTFKYLIEASKRYDEFSDFSEFLSEKVQPKLMANL